MKKLLLIEDDSDAREMMVFMFENNGYEVVQSDKEIPVEETAALKPHVIVIGQMTKGISGNDICSKLKANELTAHIPVILYLPNQDSSRITGGCADGYMAKPFELEDFVWLVSRLALS